MSLAQAPVQLMTHFVLIVPLDVTTPWMVLIRMFPSLVVDIFNAAIFHFTLASNLVESGQGSAQAMRVNSPVSGEYSAVYV